MRWDAIVVMALLLLAGIWLVYEPSPEAVPGATLVPLRIGDIKGWAEVNRSEETGEYTFRIRLRGQEPGDPIAEDAFRDVMGDEAVNRIIAFGGNQWFRLLNITSWGGVAWVLVGFGAQAVFAARFMVQWIVSEKKKESVVPEIFWWISLAGGLMLYCYFVWRKDLPAVMGQSTGIVIYARNLRLISKGKARKAQEDGNT